MIKLAFIILQLVYAAKLAEYRFGINFGQVFLDYTGNYQTSVSGSSSSSTNENNEVFSTDRGLYFDGTDSRVTNPPNDQQQTAFLLPTNWSAITWINTISTLGIILRRADNNDYLVIYRDTGNKVTAYISAGGNTLNPSSSGNTIPSGNL